MSHVVFFDGIIARVVCGHDASLQMAGDVTVECLFKNDISSQPSTSYIALLQKGISSIAGGEYSLWMEMSTRNPYFWVRKPDNSVSNQVHNNTIPSPINRNKWYHVAAVHSGNNMYMYVNGMLVGSSAPGYSGQFVANNDLELFSGVDKYYVGLGANARIYNRALSDAEIHYNYDHPNNPIKRGLVLNMTQESIQGPKWVDLSGNGNDGVYTGGAIPQLANLVTQR